MASNHGWTMSSSDDSDNDQSMLPQSGKKYRSPKKILDLKKSISNSTPPKKKDTKRRNDNKTDPVPSKRQKNFDDVSSMGYESQSTSKSIIDTWLSSCPYNFLLTTVKGIPDSYNYNSKPIGSVGIKQILSPEFGEILESVQFNYCIDMEWLIEQYPAQARSKPLLIVHGEQGPSFNEMRKHAEPYPKIEFCRVDLPPYGTHHTKMMFLRYHEGIRIVILTANLVHKDWHQKTQGMWISPVFPLKTENTTEKSSTNFKADLILYLQQYNRHKLLLHWIELIQNHDLSEAKVFLIGSVPGRHKLSFLNKWGHTKLRKILTTHVEQPSEDTTIVGQFSSIGSLGGDKNKWLTGEWLTSLSATRSKGFNFSSSSKRPTLKLIFPCLEDVRRSLEGYPAGASIPYSYKVSQKQIWLENFFNKWRAGHVGRTTAAPHIKSYARITNDHKKAFWWMITSCNLSKAAWGGFEKKDSQLSIRSYELGVLFIPKFFHSEETTRFKLSKDSSQSVTLPFELPLTPYTESDQPWVWDVAHKHLPDRNGNMWVPS